MTIKELQSEICDLRCRCEELQDKAWHTWTEAKDNRTEQIADYIHTQLEYVASCLSELEELEEENEVEWWDNCQIDEWWDNLDNADKSAITGIPTPSHNDGRGDEQYEFDDRTRKWWNARSDRQKSEIYNQNAEL